MRRFPERDRSEWRVFQALRTPEKVQDFLDTMPFNFEEEGETIRSPLAALRARKAHCIEGALLAASAFWFHGRQPLIIDLKTTKDDFEHVIAPFKEGGLWGAVSKTNHAVLRYRDPVYRTVRELVMSYFNEYFLQKNGMKTLRSYTSPWSLLRYGPDWLSAEDGLWKISEDIDAAPHHEIAGASALRRLRRADTVEIEAGAIVEWLPPRGRRSAPPEKTGRKKNS